MILKLKILDSEYINGYYKTKIKNLGMQMITKKQIRQLANKISENYNTSRIFIFGSYAYGKPNSESDLDLCIVTDLGDKRKIDLLRDIRREIISSLQLPLDILLYDHKEFDERANHRSTLEYKILKQGILLNG